MSATATMPAGSATSPDAATGPDADQLAGVLFMEGDAEVTPAEGNRRGKTPNPMDPIVVAACDQIFALKLGGKTPKGRFTGTNFTVRSVLKSTITKYIAAHEAEWAKEGITVKASYGTVEGTVSTDKRDNDKPLIMSYTLLVSKVPQAVTQH